MGRKTMYGNQKLAGKVYRQGLQASEGKTHQTPGMRTVWMRPTHQHQTSPAVADSRYRRLITKRSRKLMQRPTSGAPMAALIHVSFSGTQVASLHTSLSFVELEKAEQFAEYLESFSNFLTESQTSKKSRVKNPAKSKQIFSGRHSSAFHAENSIFQTLAAAAAWATRIPSNAADTIPPA